MACVVLAQTNVQPQMLTCRVNGCKCLNAYFFLPRAGSIRSKIADMAKVDTKTTMVADGLRYKSKVSGSPFTAATSFGAATMSCFLCGKHRPRSQLSSRKILGKSQAVCAPSCKALDEANS